MKVKHWAVRNGQRAMSDRLELLILDNDTRDEELDFTDHNEYGPMTINAEDVWYFDQLRKGEFYDMPARWLTHRCEERSNQHQNMRKVNYGGVRPWAGDGVTVLTLAKRFWKHVKKHKLEACTDFYAGVSPVSFVPKWD